MLRRGFVKLLGAAIAVPGVGQYAKRLAQRIAWNVWIGGDDGKFHDPRSWSYGRVPGDEDLTMLNLDTATWAAISIKNLALVGPGWRCIEVTYEGERCE